MLREIAAWLVAFSLCLGTGAGIPAPLPAADAAALAFAAGSICGSGHGGVPSSLPGGTVDHSCCTHACCMSGPAGVVPQGAAIRLPRLVAIAAILPAAGTSVHIQTPSPAHRPRAPPILPV